MFNPLNAARYVRDVRRTSDARSVTVSVFEIDVDDARPERVCLRDERGSKQFVTEDGGRSWAPVEAVDHQRSSTRPPRP
ncbi:MAG: hypothetical protein JNK05_27645 [Myxococcales bacterium]|nr:hypothetical protein [Myxococcales bacterium]